MHDCYNSNLTTMVSCCPCVPVHMHVQCVLQKLQRRYEMIICISKNALLSLLSCIIELMAFFEGNLLGSPLNSNMTVIKTTMSELEFHNVSFNTIYLLGHASACIAHLIENCCV